MTVTARTPSSVLSRYEIIREFRRSKSGIVGVAIILILIGMSIYSSAAIPLESFRQWNSPNYWIDLPRGAAPSWVNIGFGPKIPEHTVLYMNDATITSFEQGPLRAVVHSYELDFSFDDFPSDFMFLYSAKYGNTPPVLQVDVVRPDGKQFMVYFSSLPSSQEEVNEFSARVFSTDRSVTENLREYENAFLYDQNPSRPQMMIFADASENEVLKGKYVIRETFYFFNPEDFVGNSGVILGGRVYGLVGTDELRRDLAVGILWGAPMALFIGFTVAIAAVLIGLIYGVFAGYKGKRTDEGLMRISDVFYSLPALPILIILSVTVGRSIFLITGFLVIFGWVGMAKVSRSLALQLKNMEYVEAAKLMGQSDTRIIFKHVIPQLLPLTFASIAIAVPGAILGEAALSFLGLGDPSIPTWGQILHDANSAGAAARGLWWWIIPPGMMIAITGLAFVLIGNALDSILNPRSRKM